MQRFRGAPLELQARGLLSLVEAGKTKGRLDEKAMIEECFHLAARAQREQPLVLIGGGITEDPDFFLQRATAQKLDRLSLQAWAVRLMAMRDKAKARELFAQMALPPYRRLTCRDRLLDAPDAYYEALAVVLRDTFSAKQRAEGEVAALARTELSNTRSPAQLEPLLKQLSALEWTRDEYALLLPALGQSLGEMRVDDRTFTARAGTLYGIIPKSEEFALKARAAGVAADPVALGIRQLLAAHLPVERCADTAAPEKPPPPGVRVLPKPPHPAFEDESLPEVANYFNFKLRLPAYLPSVELPPLEKVRMTPARLAGAMEKKKIYWSNEREITRLAQGLMWGGKESPLTDDEKNTAEWKRKAAEYRRAVSDYRRVEGQPAESFFLHKAGLIMALWAQMPVAVEKSEVLADAVRFIASVDKREVGLDLWVLGVRDMMDRARRGQADRSVPPEVLEALTQSGDQVMTLVAEMNWNLN
ncbi:MAG: hypothetical protein HZB13_16615 [Acidobacteria bacterium]|nr:hypothetical protein [Acidobacteriota bacterium]